MALTLPKHVVLTNVKLNLLYYGIIIIFGIGLSVRYLNLRQNSVVAVPDGQVSAWADGAHDKDRAVLISTMASFNQTLCQNPALYEYWWDAAGEWRQGPHKCANLCSPSGARSDADLCVRPAETYIQEASDMIFFVTEFGERYMDTEASDRHYFVPSTDALSLGFEYSFNVYDNGAWESNTVTGSMTSYSSSKDILTVLVDSNQDGEFQVEGIFEPHEHITLTVPQMTRLAGRPLDLIQPQSGANKKPGAAFPSGPLARMAGVELNIHLLCHRSVSHAVDYINRDVGSEYEDWAGPVCVAEVRPSPVWRARKEIVEVIESDGSLRKRHYHGVRVRFTVGGSYRFFDWNKVLLNLAAIVVYMSLPAKFMLFFCVYGLGHLSTMYRQAIYQQCDLLEQCAGMAARLLSVSTSFGHLQDIFDAENHGISRTRLKASLQQIVQYRDDILDEDEFERLVNFLFHTLVSYHEIQSQDLIQLRSLLGQKDLKSAVKERVSVITEEVRGQMAHEIKRVREDATITADDFAVAHASNEPFSFVSFLQLFDADRKPCFMEQLFMQRNIRTAREENAEALLVGNSRRTDRGDDSMDTFRSKSMCDWLCCCLNSGENEPRAQLSETSTESKSKMPRAPKAVQLGKSSKMQQSFEPCPEPADGNGPVPERLTTMEATLRRCQEEIGDNLRVINARLDRLEAGVTAYRHEMAPIRKRMDMLDALTGHTSVSSLPDTLGSYGIIDDPLGPLTPSLTTQITPPKSGAERSPVPSVVPPPGGKHLDRKGTGTFLSPREPSPRPMSPQVVEPLQYPTSTGLSPEVQKRESMTSNEPPIHQPSRVHHNVKSTVTTTAAKMKRITRITRKPRATTKDNEKDGPDGLGFGKQDSDAEWTGTRTTGNFAAASSSDQIAHLSEPREMQTSSSRSKTSVRPHRNPLTQIKDRSGRTPNPKESKECRQDFPHTEEPLTF